MKNKKPSIENDEGFYIVTCRNDTLYEKEQKERYKQTFFEKLEKVCLRAWRLEETGRNKFDLLPQSMPISL